MKLIRYGITLRRITETDIEKVRIARNAIRHLMQYKEYITPQMQMDWFRSIDNANNFYYIIEYEGKDTGLIHEKNASVVPGQKFETSEGGIFMFEDIYQSTHLPVLAALILIEKGFYIFGDSESVIHTLSDNEKAIRFNKALGYELCEGFENKQVHKYILTKENFEKKTASLRKMALKLSKTENILKIILSAEDFQSGLGQQLEKIFGSVGLYPAFEDHAEKIFIHSFGEVF